MVTLDTSIASTPSIIIMLNSILKHSRSTPAFKINIIFDIFVARAMYWQPLSTYDPINAFHGLVVLIIHRKLANHCFSRQMDVFKFFWIGIVTWINILCYILDIYIWHYTVCILVLWYWQNNPIIINVLNINTMFIENCHRKNIINISNPVCLYQNVQNPKAAFSLHYTGIIKKQKYFKYWCKT